MKKSSWIKERFTPNETHSHKIKHFLVSKKTKFQYAVLADSYSFGRCLILDGEMQSAEVDEFIYHECLVHPAMTMHPDPKDILILGGGEGATTREVLRYKNLNTVTTVDIDGEVVDFCKKYLKKWHQGSFTHPKSQIIIEDAGSYVANTEKKFDVIISDLPTPIEGGPAYMLYTIEFYKKLKQLLKPGGIFSFQSGSGNLLQLKFHAMHFNTLKNIMKNIFSFYAYVPSFDVPWAFIVCGDDNLNITIKTAEIEKRLKQRLISQLKFYDACAHIGLFNIPKYMRNLLNKEKKLISNKKLIYFFK